MIQLRKKNSNGLQDEVPFEITVFPDHTSQVWKIKDTKTSPASEYEILWLFEQEAELLHVLQLHRLLKSEFGSQAKLHVPYLPYARQDKEISNQSTWALHFFADLLKTAGIQEIRTFDQHSAHYFKSQSAENFHKSVVDHDLICFPDKGARQRYPHLFEHPYIFFDKVRNQLTGQIEGLQLHANGQALEGKTVLIVDDLCDGGGTFTHVAAELLKQKTARVDLCVSHGLFSKGLGVLHDAGIKNIFTTNSILKNKNGFSVWK